MPERRHRTGWDEREQAQLNGLRAALDNAGIERDELWFRYFGIGGSVGQYEVDAYLHRLMSLPPLERDLLAQAANELIDERPALPRAPYTDDEQQAGPAVESEGPGGKDL